MPSVAATAAGKEGVREPQTGPPSTEARTPLTGRSPVRRTGLPSDGYGQVTAEGQAGRSLPRPVMDIMMLMNWNQGCGAVTFLVGSGSGSGSGEAFRLRLRLRL